MKTDFRKYGNLLAFNLPIIFNFGAHRGVGIFPTLPTPINLSGIYEKIDSDEF